MAESDAKRAVEAFYEEVAINKEDIARAVLYAISEPYNIDVSDIVIRSSKEA